MISIHDYLEVRFEYSENNYEQIYNALYIFGIENILEENNKIIIDLPINNYNLVDEIKKFMIVNSIINEDKISISEFDNKNWNSEWEKSIEPVLIKDKIIIYPGWKKPELKDTSDKILIKIEPKMSFGTGHNETTQLILEFLVDEIDNNDKFMLDYGCGTGILSIAASKLGVKKVMAIDIDEDSIQNAEEYIDNNHVKDEIKLFKGNISDIQETGFDIICANIIRSVIEDNLNIIYSKLKYNGKLFISGVLIDEQNKILASLNKNNFKIENIIQKAEWLGIYAKKK